MLQDLNARLMPSQQELTLVLPIPLLRLHLHLALLPLLLLLHLLVDVDWGLRLLQSRSVKCNGSWYTGFNFN